MRQQFRSSLIPAILATIASLLLTTGVLAAETKLTADLGDAGSGDAEGSGTALITIDPDTGEVCWDLSVEGIGDAVASHIHVGAEGEDGDVVVPLDEDGFSGTSSGCVDASNADLAAILANPADYYVNIHTEEFPNGAIRGQLTAESPDTAMEAPSASPLVTLGLLIVALSVLLGVRMGRGAPESR
jgi:hypothetical protein